MTARVGGILAPYVALMGQLPGLSIAFPVVIFAVVGTIAGILMYWIPETVFTPMHQTIEEAEAAKDDYGIPCCGKTNEIRFLQVPVRQFTTLTSAFQLRPQGTSPGLSIAFPVVTFAVVATLAGILMYWIPETVFSPMHQTIEEAEAAKDDYGIPCCGRRLNRQRKSVAEENDAIKMEDLVKE
ncbi:hypothetical protein OS493_037388 [Desmophyllum pertusum]|uniref:Uncharacterized protein n=1 Tax=Desmophyllum pertusum TaxID=174260 RepID=A0A9W9ZWX5_9CNID|nr:hypothetical protein OS493_037388 [Desmophyllum pertusum]